MVLDNVMHKLLVLMIHLIQGGPQLRQDTIQLYKLYWIK